MNEEIRRIVRRLYVSRRTDIPWALIITLLIFAGTGAVYGQPLPCATVQVAAPPDPVATYAQYHRPEHDWIALQMQKTPNQKCAAPAPGQGDLQLKLEYLRGQIAVLECRLAELDQKKQHPPIRVAPPKPRQPAPDAHIEELNRHRDELAERARHMEMELQELHQNMETHQRDIENEVSGIHEEMEELMRRHRELAERAHQREMELNELHANTERRQDEISMELREIHEQMKGIEEELARIERERQEHRRRLLDEVRGQTQELREQLRMLEARAERIQRALDELGEGDGEAVELRRALEETRAQIRFIESQLSGRRAPLPRPPRQRPMGPPPKPSGACEDVSAQIEATRLELNALRPCAQEISAQLTVRRVRSHPGTIGSAGDCAYWH